MSKKWRRVNIFNSRSGSATRAKAGLREKKAGLKKKVSIEVCNAREYKRQRLEPPSGQRAYDARVGGVLEGKAVKKTKALSRTQESKIWRGVWVSP